MVATFKLLQIQTIYVKQNNPGSDLTTNNGIVTSKLFRSNRPLSFLTTTK